MALGVGLRVPVGRLKVYGEVDLVRQSYPVDDYMEAYLTTGFQVTMHDRLDLSIGPSIGLTSKSLDWRVGVTLGVRF